MTIVGNIFQSAVQWSNPYLVPAANRRAAGRLVNQAGELVRSVEFAISSAVGYFEALPRLDVAALVLLGRLNRAGFDPRLGFVERRIDEFTGRFADPHLRLLDASYVEPSESAAVTPAAYGNPILQLMIRCLYADRNGDGDLCLQQLARIDDGGRYGTTHIVVGGLMLREFGAVPDRLVVPMIQSVAGTLVAAQRIDRAGDLFAERIAILQWLDCHDMVDPVWILRLLKAQRANGGWTAGPSLRPARPNQHTSVLALIALAQWLAGVTSADASAAPAKNVAGPRTFWRPFGDAVAPSRQA